MSYADGEVERREKLSLCWKHLANKCSGYIRINVFIRLYP